MHAIEGLSKFDGSAKPGNDHVTNSKSTRKHVARVSLLPEQFEVLERVYGNNLYPDTPLQRKLADDLKVEFRTVKRWFNQRREKQRRRERKCKGYIIKACKS